MANTVQVDPLANYKMPKFSGKVLVYGDIMLDRYWRGEVSRISPEAPVPVVQINASEDLPGGAANVALNIAALGVGCGLWGIAGDDANGRILQQQLQAKNVDTHFQLDSSIATITKLRVSGRSQQMIRLDFEQSLANISQKSLRNDFQAQLAQAKCVVLSDYAKGTLHEVQDLIAQARVAGVPCLIDPKGSDFSHYRGATLLTPNYKEFLAVVGACQDEAEIVRKGSLLLDDLQLSALLITRGALGMTLLEKNATTAEVKATHIATRARQVFDVTGAGDTVIAVISSLLAAGESLEFAVRIANLAAGEVVGRLGPAALTSSELRRALQKTIMPDQAIMDVDCLLGAVAQAKLQQQRIVMTNGCFDLLHAGHVHYLEQARSLGDRLIVAVNDDASVAGLKGKDRPVQTLADRMSVLAGLRAVDYVVSFSEATPESLINKILPHILVKGGDYRVEDIAGHKAVLANGGQVKQLDFIPGCSTSELITKIRQ